jgi:hypothetical protein
MPMRYLVLVSDNDRTIATEEQAQMAALKAIERLLTSGIDEEIWLYHLYRGDFSRWFRDAVKDPYLADHAERIEQRKDLRPGETRDLIRSFIERSYTELHRSSLHVAAVASCGGVKLGWLARPEQ